MPSLRGPDSPASSCSGRPGRPWRSTLSAAARCLSEGATATGGQAWAAPYPAGRPLRRCEACTMEEVLSCMVARSMPQTQTRVVCCAGPSARRPRRLWPGKARPRGPLTVSARCSASLSPPRASLSSRTMATTASSAWQTPIQRSWAAVCLRLSSPGQWHVPERRCTYSLTAGPLSGSSSGVCPLSQSRAAAMRAARRSSMDRQPASSSPMRVRCT
mmetsp:Transcript_52722/g.163782  ORF Transcript_52722/g.163782 Transcript_52722/m.163782 type:complete len:216 (+) Transcript_52722:616-1263(+)